MSTNQKSPGKIIIVSDESKFNIFGSDGTQKVCRKQDTSFGRKKRLSKHSGGHLMIWKCKYFHGVGGMVFIE